MHNISQVASLRCITNIDFIVVSLQCRLHIHGSYSTTMKMNVPMLPLSQSSAVGLILAHGITTKHTHTQIFRCIHFTKCFLTPSPSLSPGSVGDAESAVSPDVYVSDDGGYSWLLALRGPHHYAILDSGGLLVAVEHTNSPVNQIK